MTVNQIKRPMAGAKKYACLTLVCLMTACSGNVQNETQRIPGDVELLEPVGVASNYETASRRNLYDASVYYAIVCPYVEEYALGSSVSFEAYDVYPGQEVKKGGAILHADMEGVDRQIENLQKSITDMDESYRDFVEQNTEAGKQPLEAQRLYSQAVDNMNRAKPEQFLVETDPETSEEIQVANPEYEAWVAELKGYEGRLASANQSLIELEEALKERTELYRLDRAYTQLQIERLKEDKAEGTLYSGMDGYVAGLRFYTEGDWVPGNQPLMAVCDVSKVDIRCEYISKADIKDAEDVYAIVNGKRYEVEYDESETEANGRQYSVFHVTADAEELEMGSYAVIVVKKETRENVLTVPSDSINQDVDGQYVYLVNGEENVYVAVRTGMTDGMYTEILSGVQEGDRVLTDNALTAGEGTVTVELGEIGNIFQCYGYLYYPSVEWISNPVEYGTCYFVESLVVQYQQVKKGEILATIRVVPDELEISRNEQKLRREQERLADLRKAGEEKNEREIAQKEETIRELEELIADMKSDAAITQIVAPKNGIITYVQDIEEDSLLGRNAGIFILADESMSYILAEDVLGVLSYGNEVRINYTDKEKNKRQASGDVVTLNKMALSTGLVTDGALIRISPEDIGNIAGSSENERGGWSRGYFQIEVPIRSMKNVLLVPKSIVMEKYGKTYVKVRLESGEVQYRSFIAGGSNADNYWVVDGLTEGMELCIK